MSLRFLATAVALGCLSMPASAQLHGSVGIGARHFVVTERDRTGAELVDERGVLPGLEGQVGYALGAWQLFGAAEVYEGTIDYDGQTQLGQSIRSRTTERITQLRAGVRYPVSHWLNAMAALEVEEWRRDIRGVRAARGIRERYTSPRLLAGVDSQWRVQGLGAVTTAATAVLMRPESVHVDFSGVLDDASLKTRSAAGIRLMASLAPDVIPALRLNAGLDWIKVGRSRSADVTRAGQLAGQVTQPEHEKRSVTLSLHYAY